jgi:hypothetical protein
MIQCRPSIAEDEVPVEDGARGDGGVARRAVNRKPDEARWIIGGVWDHWIPYNGKYLLQSMSVEDENRRVNLTFTIFAWYCLPSPERRVTDRPVYFAIVRSRGRNDDVSR